MPNQELQVDNTSGYPQFSDISDDELLQATQTIEQKYFESNTCIKNQEMPKDRFKSPVSEEQAGKLSVYRETFKY